MLYALSNVMYEHASDNSPKNIFKDLTARIFLTMKTMLEDNSRASFFSRVFLKIYCGV